MRFAWPLVLAAVALVPLAAAAYVLVERRRARFAIRFTNLDVLASVVPEKPPRRGLVPPALFGLALMVAIVAVARPETARSVNRRQATVVLVIDTSGSMVANDVQPSRLAAAQEAVRRFVKRLPGRFEVGMVVFSSEARVAMPITPSAIVLLSDGAQNRGQLEPMKAALRAKHFKIPVYTVALGTPGGSIHISDGAFSQTITVPPDPQTLKRIALETGGRFYAAGSGARLNAVYDKLASRLSARRVYREATSVFLGISAALLLGAGVLSAFWLPRLP